MATRRAVLAGVAAALAGCQSSTAGDTTTERTTTWPWPAGEIIATPIDRDLTPEEPVVYPRGDTENEYVTQALEAGSTASNTVEIPNETALEGVRSVMREYPSVPDDVDASGVLVRFDGEYYALQLARNE